MAGYGVTLKTMRGVASKSGWGDRVDGIGVGTALNRQSAADNAQKRRESRERHNAAYERWKVSELARVGPAAFYAKPTPVVETPVLPPLPRPDEGPVTKLKPGKGLRRRKPKTVGRPWKSINGEGRPRVVYLSRAQARKWGIEQ